MAIVYQASDANEYATDTDFEQFGNQGLYGVISGCAVTYDAADMTVDIAAGTILHNGTVVAVAAQADVLTLVEDSSNKRWSYVALDSSGTAALVSGDAAADSSTEPTKPELGDNVLLAMVKIEGGQTVANDIAVKLDKRVMLRGPFTVILGSDYTHPQANTTLANVTGMSFALAASTTYAFEACIVYNSGATPDFKGAFTVPSGASISYGVLRNNTGTTLTDINTSGGPWTADGSGANATAYVKGFVTTSTTAGNLQLQAAQNTSDASDTKVLTGSWLRVN